MYEKEPYIGAAALITYQTLNPFDNRGRFFNYFIMLRSIVSTVLYLWLVVTWSADI